MLKALETDLAELREVVDDILHHDQRAAKSLKDAQPSENLLNRQFSISMTLRGKPSNFFRRRLAGVTIELHRVIAPYELSIFVSHSIETGHLNLVVNGIDAMKETPSENRILEIRRLVVEEFAELAVSRSLTGYPRRQT